MTIKKTIGIDLESEIMVIGAMINSNEYNKFHEINYACENLTQDYFYDIEHSKMFNCMKNRIKRGDRVDVFLLHSDLSDEISIGRIVGISQSCAQSVYIEEYCEKVELAYRTRNTLNSMIKHVKQLEEGRDCNDVLLDLSQKTCELLGNIRSKKMITIKDLISDMGDGKSLKEINEINQKIYKSGGIVDQGISSGMQDLDRVISGFRAGSINVIAARPGMGKTSFMLSLAQNMMIDQKIAVGFFSLEMMSQDIVKKLISSVSRVELSSISSGMISEDENNKINNSIDVVQNCTMIIDDQAGISVRELSSKARRMIDTHKVKIIFIDYIQIMRCDSKNKIRELEISEICAGLQILAKELNIPIVVAAQLSRKVEEREDKKPMMSDLRESGTIEQTADLVIFLMRDEYYRPDVKPGLARVIVSKNRHGAVGEISVEFKKRFGRFESLSKFELPKDFNFKIEAERDKEVCFMDDPRFM